MQNKIDLDIISFLFKAQLPSRNKQNISEAKLQSQFGKAERGRELNINNPQKNNLSNPTNSSGNNAPLSRRQRRMQERGRRR
jgi:hypothetical protein